MHSHSKFVILLDILQIIISLLAIFTSIIILISNSKEYIAISFVGVAFIALILFFNGIGNFNIDYSILKKYI